MRDYHKNIIDIIKSATDGTKAVLPENFDWKECLETGKKHRILPLIYYGLQNSGITAPEEYSRIFETAEYRALALNTNQLYETQRLFQAFEKSGIDYMPLKGCVLKPLYPKPEMRMMSDADILVRKEQYPRIKNVMGELGYTEKVESDHEYVWYKNNILIELHKRLIPSYNKDYYAYFGDGWRLARKTDRDFCYEMSKEDTFIYIFTHFAKHYRDAGIGLLHLTDLYVFIKNNPGINSEYLRSELEKLCLYRFYINIEHTLKVLFRGESPDEISDIITDSIFGFGVYGTHENHLLSAALKESAQSGSADNVRRRQLAAKLFPSYESMCKMYPSLSGKRVLLPFYWAGRGFEKIFFKRDAIKRQAEAVRLVSGDNIRSYSESLKKVGLDFNFK